MSNLDTAIQLIRQGNLAQAQKILEPIVRTELNNVQAWLWYSQTWPSQEMRLKVLVTCLKFNPGNEQVLQAIRLAKGSSPAPASRPVAVNLADVPARQVSAPLAEPRQTFIQPNEQPPVSKAAFNWDELEKESAPVAPVVAAQFLPENLENPPAQPGKKAPRRSYPFYEVWFMALTRPDVQVYVDLLDDPEAGVSRAIEWQVYTNLAIFSLSAVIGFFQVQSIFAMPEFQELRDVAPIFNSFDSGLGLLLFLVVFVLAGTLFSILGLLFNGALQNFLAHLLGGQGNFSRTVYALSAYLIPITIITSIIGFIPLVNCLTILISIYALVLNIRALQAAHFMNGGRATIVVLIPTLILLMFACGSVLFLPVWARSVLPNPNSFPTP